MAEGQVRVVEESGPKINAVKEPTVDLGGALSPTTGPLDRKRIQTIRLPLFWTPAVGRSAQRKNFPPPLAIFERSKNYLAHTLLVRLLSKAVVINAKGKAHMLEVC